MNFQPRELTPHPRLVTFNDAVFHAPARGLLTTAPHIFTDRGHTLENIEKILDAHACLGIEISHGVFSLGMDLADAHWEIIRRRDVEPRINYIDRPCERIPEIAEVETPEGKALLESYWNIYNHAKTHPGIKNGKNDDRADVLNILVLRGELNATRGTFTFHDFQNHEGIADDMQDLWLSPLKKHSNLYRDGYRGNPLNNEVIKLKSPDERPLRLV